MIKRSLVVIAALFIIGTVLTVSAKTTAKPKKVQKVTVNLEREAYRPDSLKLRRGVLAKITFIRKAEDGCGQVIVIPAYGVHRDLPLNQPVTVTFTPRKNGMFNFTCGMNMMRGQIIVN